MMAHLLTFLAVKSVVIIALFAAFNVSSVGGFGWTSNKDVAIPDYKFDDLSRIDITSNLKTPIDVVLSVANMPPCNKVATSKLINSCRFPTDKHAKFDFVSNYYAANLAVCELKDAGVAYPGDCELFSSDPNMSPKLPINGMFPSGMLDRPAFSFHDFDKSTRKSADKCVKALAGKAQWWTSFSNNKQNAYQICHAYRSDIERDALMEAVSDMAGRASDIDMKLFTSITSAEEMLTLLSNLRQAQAESSEEFRVAVASIVGSVDSFHGQMTEQARRDLVALAENHNRAMAFFDQSMDGIKQVMIDVRMMGGLLENAEQAASRLQVNLEALDDLSLTAGQTIQKTFENVSSNLDFISNSSEIFRGNIEPFVPLIKDVTGSWIFKVGTQRETLIKLGQSSLHAAGAFCLFLPLIYHDFFFGIFGSVMVSMGVYIFVFAWAMVAQDFASDSLVALATAMITGGVLAEYLRMVLKSDGSILRLARAVLGRTAD